MARNELGGARRFQDNFRTLTSSFRAGEAAPGFRNVMLYSRNTCPSLRQVSCQQSGSASGGVSLAGRVRRPGEVEQAFCPERGPCSARGPLQHLRAWHGDRAGQELQASPADP